MSEGPPKRVRKPKPKRCHNCGELGHLVAECSNEKKEKPVRVPQEPREREATDDSEKTCYNCNGTGHIARNCDQERDATKIRDFRMSQRRCFNCGKSGHLSKDCEAPAGNKACYNCGQDGHISKDCPSKEIENNQNGKSMPKK
ncbi:hypothetical protein ScalyP_jg11614 [Parmales sp. scaly parma]|nr:hypothetical protein ScalyP_jg11614 [Parmales sp. scaly parma]